MKEEPQTTMNLSTEQFEKLLSVIGNQQRRGSFTTCKVSFNGARDTESVESFLAAASVFKSVEQISDDDAIMSIPLILREEAATWWNGIKEQVKTWDEFVSRVRHAFAPKRPAYQLYQNIVNIKQGEDELTEVFVAKKRALIAQMPEPHTETQQIDMIYGQLRYKIRIKLPRETVNTLDALVKAARGVEELLVEKEMPEKETEKVSFKKKRCTYCRLPGHSIETCRKKEKKDLASGSGTSAAKPAPANAATGTQAPSPSTPKFSCYGCGTPGVVRSKCTTCAKAVPKEGKTEVSFCSFNPQADVRPRPVIGIAIGKITGSAYVDTCAKASVASYTLYKCLRRLGFAFHTQQFVVKLADGTKTTRDVLTVNAPVSVCYRVVQTNFIVFPEARESRTLLGVGFIEDAKMVLNVPQKTWYFEDYPDDIFDLQDEDDEEISMAKVEATPVYFDPQLRTMLKDVELPEFISPLSITPRDEGVLEPALPQFSACIPATGSSLSSGEPALPTTSACTTNTMSYRVVPIDLSPIPRKRSRPLFDGYSPRFVDFMVRDAQMQLHDAPCELSPHSKALFPSDQSNSSNDVEIGSLEVEEVSSDTLDATQKSQLMEVLWDYQEVFSEGGEPTTLAEHCIDTGEHNPVSVPPYRLSPPRMVVLKNEVKKMLASGVIEACSSPWSAPVVMVPKKDGSVRVCVDYRRLNAITVPDKYPIPRIDDLLHAAKPTPFMSTLDLRAGYWQVKVKLEDQDKTSFITPFGMYRFKRMPFGLRNAPSTFQRLIDRIRVSLENVKMLAYLDDLIIFSSTYQAHLTDLGKVLSKLKESNLHVNFSKCRFCCSTIKYLGHIITPEGLKADPEKVAAILANPAPKNLKHLMTFLQTCSWYRRFIPNFAGISEPLSRLTKKNAVWTWSAEQEQSYQELKIRLTSTPVLRQADETRGYIIKSDASNYALGAVLVQGEGQDEHPVEYASRLMIPAERNYSTTEREALAVVWAIKKFRGYIEGLPVTVVTDHQALRWLMSLRSPTGRLARWALQIQAYDITIKYTPGRTNVVADTLSRPICDESTENTCGVCSMAVDMPQRPTSEIRAEQLKDEHITSIVTALEDADRKDNAVYWSNKGYVMNNGLLYRYHPSDDSDEAQLVVPQHEWANVLSVYHDDPLAGHYGADKTYQRISKRYHWKGMRKYIEAYVKNCVACQRFKPSNLKPAGLLQTTPVNQRFETLAFDLFGPLPSTTSGKTWILVAEDIATGWIELFALETASAENCATVLMNEVFLRYGVPRRLISDNGPQFVSAVMQQLTFCLRIKHTFTPVYHPAANPVERKNRDLKTQLAILVGDEHGSWSDMLPSIRFAMNTATCLTTGQTPAYLTFARELRTPDDNVHDFRQILLSENFVPEITPKLLLVANTLDKARDVRENLEEHRKKTADQGRREDPGYTPGDLVLATTHPISNAARGISAKFCPRRDGPYLILARHGASSYLISDPTAPDKPLGVYHTSALTPFRGHAASPLPPPVRPLRKRGRPPKPRTNPEGATPPSRGRGRPRRRGSRPATLVDHTS